MTRKSDIDNAATGTICVVADRWPRFSSTFVAQELVGLEKEGLTLRLATFGKPDKVKHAILDELQARIHRLPTTPWKSLRYWKALAKVRFRPGYAKARALLEADRAYSRKPKKLNKYFGRAVVLAAELPADTTVVYAHFLNLTTTIARYAAAIAGLPLTASGHARDIWTASEDELRAKLKQLEWCATCTAPGAERLKELADDPDKIHLVYHGLSFERLPADMPERSRRDGSDPNDPVLLLSVGRAVEKKGFDVLLDALASLPSDLAWRWHHVGMGALLQPLKDRAAKLGLSDRIEWHGAEDHSTVIERNRTCDLFVLPSREAEDGDRDGLPNVLMEAQSQGLACLSTTFSAIPELIVDGETGVLVPPGDMPALARELERLIRSPDERIRIGEAGYRRVRGAFEAETGIRHIAALLRKTAA
jgi:glycosyltransferase involved in cell wall biosynthesis